MAGAKPGKERGKDHGRGSRAGHVYDALRAAIQGGRYWPGARLREAAVADWLVVSRTPVREAFRRLEANGLLVTAPWRGVEVARLDRRQVVELHAMRQILEGAAARLAAQHVSRSEVLMLEQLLRREAAQEGAPDKLAETNQSSSGAPRHRRGGRCERR